LSPAEVILITAAASVGNIAATLVIVSAFTRKASDALVSGITRYVYSEHADTRMKIDNEAEVIRAFVAAALPKKRGRKPKASEPST
jgi:hypothetical protein